MTLSACQETPAGYPAVKLPRAEHTLKRLSALHRAQQAGEHPTAEVSAETLSKRLTGQPSSILASIMKEDSTANGNAPGRGQGNVVAKQSRSAGFQPAVLQCFQPAGAPNGLRLTRWRRSADWKSAIQRNAAKPQPDFLECGGKRSATPLWLHGPPSEKRCRRCALPPQSKIVAACDDSERY